jgi:hypothetical protein
MLNKNCRLENSSCNYYPEEFFECELLKKNLSSKFSRRIWRENYTKNIEEYHQLICVLSYSIIQSESRFFYIEVHL